MTGCKYDLIIIGAGPGGYSAALKAATLKMRVAVIEKGQVGGTCLNRGCIPTKALLHASSMFAMMQNCDEFGVSADFISFDFKKMQGYKERAVEKCRKEVENLFVENNIDIIYGTAVVDSGKRVVVTSSTGVEIYQAGHIILATGAETMLPDIPGIHLPGVWTSDRILGSDAWMFDRLMILGGGVIGVELATIFKALCANVTIIEKESRLLGPMDQEVSASLERQLVEKGIQIHCKTVVEEIWKEDTLVCAARIDGEEITFKTGQILIAAGRKPCLDGLFTDENEFNMAAGRLVVDENFMTGVQDIYAIGDVVAEIQLAHVAAAQGVYVVEKIAGVPHSTRLKVVPAGMFTALPIVPNCIYTDPEIATVGISETAARAARMRVRCGKYDMRTNGKSIISKDEDGFIRLIFEEYSKQLVGAQIVCKRATDMIGEMATAVANGLTASQLSLAMRAHPTYSEGITAAIADAMKRGEDQDETGSV